MADPAREDEFYYLLTEGSELLSAGKVDDARKHFERALQMNPSHEQALNLLGLSLFRLNHLDRARQIFDELVHTNPIEPSLRLNLAMVHLKTGKVDEAKVELERVLELSPDHPRATSYMGLVMERRGDLDRAAVYYERAGNKKRADEIRAFRPTATGTFPMPNLAQLVTQPPTLPPGPAAMASLSSPPSAPRPVAASSSPPAAAVSSLVTEPFATLAVPTLPPATVQPERTMPLTAAPAATLPATAAPAPAVLPAPDQVEAAALTAATAAQLSRASTAPTAQTVESARGASMGFTLEVARASSAAATLPPVPAAFGGELPQQALSDLLASSVVGAHTTHVHGTLSVPIVDVGYVRTDLLVALAGAFEVESVQRRYRGKRTDSLFGGTDAALISLQGNGHAHLAVGALTLTHLALHNEELYLVEACMVAFTQGLVWENGRLPSEADKDLDIVHLRGTGRIVIGTKAPILAIAATPAAPVSVQAFRLVGWNGQVVPYRAPLPGVVPAAKHVPVVRFEGTGMVLAT